jgi:hypothetical protein
MLDYLLRIGNLTEDMANLLAAEQRDARFTAT